VGPPTRTGLLSPDSLAKVRHSKVSPSPRVHPRESIGEYFSDQPDFRSPDFMGCRLANWDCAAREEQVILGGESDGISECRGWE
jgi:hypothetical protein